MLSNYSLGDGESGPITRAGMLGFPGGTSAKNPPANGGDVKRHGFSSWVGKTPLEEGMTIHPSILAWRLPWTESGELWSMGSHRLKQLNIHTRWE